MVKNYSFGLYMSSLSGQEAKNKGSIKLKIRDGKDGKKWMKKGAQKIFFEQRKTATSSGKITLYWNRKE